MRKCATGRLQAGREEDRAVDATLESGTGSQFSRAEVEKSVVEGSGGVVEGSRKSGGGSRVKKQKRKPLAKVEPAMAGRGGWSQLRQADWSRPPPAASSLVWRSQLLS